MGFAASANLCTMQYVFIMYELFWLKSVVTPDVTPVITLAPSMATEIDLSKDIQYILKTDLTQSNHWAVPPDNSITDKSCNNYNCFFKYRTYIINVFSVLRSVDSSSTTLKYSDIFKSSISSSSSTTFWRATCISETLSQLLYCTFFALRSLDTLSTPYEIKNKNKL